MFQDSSSKLVPLSNSGLMADDPSSRQPELLAMDERERSCLLDLLGVAI
jgi:hypothetical protein